MNAQPKQLTAHSHGGLLVSRQCIQEQTDCMGKCCGGDAPDRMLEFRAQELDNLGSSDSRKEPGMNTSAHCDWPKRTKRIPGVLAVLLLAGAAAADPPAAATARTWPQPYAVARDEASGTLRLRTPYYCVEQDLKKGGAISRIALTHGKAANLLVHPLETQVRDESGAAWSDLNDSVPAVAHRREDLTEIVTVECELKGPDGRASGIRVKSIYRYRWGYIRVRKEFTAAAGLRAKEVWAVRAVVAPSLTHYGYRDGRTEEQGAPPFSFGSNIWGKLRPGQSSDRSVRTPHVPRSVILADPGIEGIEWFASSDLAQWDLQLAGRRGLGQFVLEPSASPGGLRLELAPLRSETGVALPGAFAFDYYLAFPIRDGRAQKPWLHTTFNRNRGQWVAPEEIRRWADKGIQTVHCHNDGDYYGDGLFWRDGSYPPYPDMDRYDKVLAECRRLGIRTATYFSNKELHPSTEAFKKNGQAWGRTDRKGGLRHNFYKPGSEFGAQMCLRSPWLEFLKSSIDRVLKNHPLDGVYYDWNVSLLCYNAAHEGKADASSPGQGHWDVDELVDLMEWTRRRVGPGGLIIVHNTTTPMFVTENFSDYVVATEWGYGKWTDRAPDLQGLPLEWSLVGAVPRGVISYGTLTPKSPRRLHRVFAIQALLGGVAPWPASAETFELLPVLKPIGDLSTCRFADWRTQAVTLSDPRCAAAVYSRAREAYILLANLEAQAREVTCRVHPDKLPHALPAGLTSARLIQPAATTTPAQAKEGPANLDARKLAADGLKITIPADGLLLLHVQ